MGSVSVVLKNANGKMNTFDRTEGFVLLIKSFFLFFLYRTTTTAPKRHFFCVSSTISPSKQYFGQRKYLQVLFKTTWHKVTTNILFYLYFFIYFFLSQMLKKQCISFKLHLCYDYYFSAEPAQSLFIKSKLQLFLFYFFSHLQAMEQQLRAAVRVVPRDIWQLQLFKHSIVMQDVRLADRDVRIFIMWLRQCAVSEHGGHAS